MIEMVSVKGEFESLLAFTPTPHFLEPSLMIKGIVPEECFIFKSALAPLGLTFRTVDDQHYQVIVKSGDDMRQDQLMIQMILLMDNLLKRENLDLKLTPYSVLATGGTSGLLDCGRGLSFLPGGQPDDGSLTGMVQRIKSQSLDHVIKEGDIHRFFKKFHPDPAGPYGVAADVIDTFVKSCAGYSVITHILGIGDRHLENLMLTPDGNMFHIDFGFILGNENKPFPPPMKLCKEVRAVLRNAQIANEGRRLRLHRW
jgi:phosphatidylinositol 3-kinase